VLPEDLDWDTREEDVALSMDAIKRCLANMLDMRDAPQIKGGMVLPLACSEQELITAQEPPWLWFTLPELGFRMITDEYRRPIHPEVEEYMRRYVTDEQDWEQVDNEECWGMNYTGPKTEIKDKIESTEIKDRIESILHSWRGEHPESNSLSGNNRNQREKGSLFHMHLETPKPY